MQWQLNGFRLSDLSWWPASQSRQLTFESVFVFLFELFYQHLQIAQSLYQFLMSLNAIEIPIIVRSSQKSIQTI